MSKPVLCLLALSVLGVAAWLAGIRVGNSDPEMAHAVRPDYSALPDPNSGTRASAVGVMAGTPESSRIAAEHWLARSRQLGRCAELLALDPEQIITRQKRIADAYANDAAQLNLPYDPSTYPAEVEGRIADILAERQRCQQMPAAELALSMPLLERAARAGNVVAMEDYANRVIQRSGNAQEVFEDIEEVARRKRLAYGFLRQLAASGNCMVSSGLEQLAPDPGSRYAFALVSVEMTRRFNDRLNLEATAGNVAFMQARAAERGEGLAAPQLAGARRLASAILANCR